jgi:hypothetical protein
MTRREKVGTDEEALLPQLERSRNMQKPESSVTGRRTYVTLSQRSISPQPGVTMNMFTLLVTSLLKEE